MLETVAADLVIGAAAPPTPSVAKADEGKPCDVERGGEDDDDDDDDIAGDITPACFEKLFDAPSATRCTKPDSNHAWKDKGDEGFDYTGLQIMDEIVCDDDDAAVLKEEKIIERVEKALLAAKKNSRGRRSMGGGRTN